MALIRLQARGVGPFEDLDLDLSDGQGRPHLGPHILAGVNGSGKTTALRAIAWALCQGEPTFPAEEWTQLLQEGAQSVASLGGETLHRKSAVLWCSKGTAELRDFQSLLEAEEGAPLEALNPEAIRDRPAAVWVAKGKLVVPGRRRFVVAAYSPSRALRRVGHEQRSPGNGRWTADDFSFEHAVDNARVQIWLKELFARVAIRRLSGEEAERQAALLKAAKDALSEIADAPVEISVTTEHDLEPVICFRGRFLNFSQIPDGIRFIVGLLSDVLRRLDSPGWDPALDARPGILLIDEIDAHLHPRWQRAILPALKKALPDVQIIVTTHSPFVITSCQGARVHVLDVDEHGRAHARPPEDAPFGASLQATMKDIFGVSSQFDLQTERELRRWNELKRREHVGALKAQESEELAKLVDELSQRSEELRSIVGLPPQVPDSVIQALLSR